MTNPYDPMTALLDLTAELPVFSVAIAGLILFLLGLSIRRGVDNRADRCARCRGNARHHQRLITRPAWSGWPGHHVTVFPYGDHLDPGVLDGWEPLPSPIPPAPTGHETRIWLLTERLIETARWESPPDVLDITRWPEPTYSTTELMETIR